MSDSGKKPGPVPIGLAQYPALLRKDQIKAIRAVGTRKGNAFVRDLIDFGLDHKPLFFRWVATRDKNATPSQEATQ